MSFSPYKPFIAWLAAAAALGGCAGNGAGLDANGEPIGPGSGGGATTPLTADFASIQANVFTPVCSPCHSGASAPEGLMLDAGHSYNLLVGISSNEVPALQRVKASDPDSSYLVLKIQGSAGIVGGQMPLHETPLPQATIDVIRQWIANGAPQGTVLASAAGAMEKLQALGNSEPATPFAVSETSPLDNAIITAPVRRIVVAFNHEVDASLVNYTTLTLERVATPGAAATTMGTVATQESAPNVVPAAAALAEGNSAVVVISPLQPLLTGTYRVSVRGTGGGALADLDVQTLGSDYSFTFTVDVSP
jgi:methionine-rich copper-binding protein CopC